MPFNAADWQKEIYLSGLAGKMPLVPHDDAALEQKAAGALTPEAFAYIAGGAGAGSTMRANRSAFEKWHILPRMLRDVSERDTSIELFGSTLPCPACWPP